jgi:hypothetical protein
MQWELIPRRGIRIGGTEILLGTSREDNRGLMAALPLSRENHRDGEDQFVSDGTMIFLRYTGDTLDRIMFIRGNLSLEGLELHETSWAELEGALAARGYTFDDPEYFADGLECPELGVNIATQEDVGGDGDGIEWVSLWQQSP